MKRGDHIKVSRGVFTHHGIYVGNGTVIHYSGEVTRKDNASVRRDPLSTFQDGGTLEVVEYGRCLGTDEVIARAERRLGERQYALLWNNCEHFARWCKTGDASSEQVDDAVATTAGVGTSSAATAASLGVVSAVGTAAGLSGPGILSGLATVGGVVGTGAVGGVAALAAGPAAITTFAMRQVLADDASLPEAEREARAAGRTATAIGGGASVVASVCAISAAGSVAGLSGAGIASGLAAIGGTVGGGMAAGVAMTVGLPAVGAAAAGYGIYRLWRSLID